MESKRDQESLQCVSCQRETSGAHSCKICGKCCHALPDCALLSDTEEEGYGAKVICLSCAPDQKEDSERGITAPPSGKQSSNAFKLMMQAKPESAAGQASKRPKSGHERTQGAVCLLCFKEYKKNHKKKFSFARFNTSSMKDHMKVHDCSRDYVNCNDPRASEAMAVLKNLEKRKTDDTIKAKKPRFDIEEESERCEIITVMASAFEGETLEEDVQVIKPMSPLKENLDGQCTSQPAGYVAPVLGAYPEMQPLGTEQKFGQQGSIDKYFSSKATDEDKTVLEYIASKIAEKVSNSTKSLSASKETSNLVAKEGKVMSAKNLTEFLSIEPNIELIGEMDSWVLRCRACHYYLSNPIASSTMKRKPTGNSLATGLLISAEDYQRFTQEGSCACAEWRRLKHRMSKHLTGASKTHQNSAEYSKEQQLHKNRQKIAIRNQLRSAIGVVQSKSAALHYETRIAELHQAGADVGDFGHSRILFTQMLEVACHFINKETREYLQTCLPNTGLPPHYYVSADKSTNHRKSNQVTMVCPVVEGKKTPIPVGMNEVYEKSDGSGGRGKELAERIYKDLEIHLGVKGEGILQMQGKVTDGQYINEPFVSRMNDPIFDLLRSFGLDQQDLDVLLKDTWWECHWDPGHWLDKVFSKFKEEIFVSRLLGRVSLFHQIFRHGKMHSLARKTASELELPFRVTNGYAPQRFMSSSYLSLKRLEISYEAYVETFKDHHNEEEMRYKLCGIDFIFDLCGILDLLWPIVVLMLKAQLQWCPGWKFPAFIKAALSQIELFASEVTKEVPSTAASPRLNKHAEDIKNYQFKSVELEPGWIIVGREANGDFKWLARDLKDCRQDLKSLAEKIKEELEHRFDSCFPELNHTLHKCLDFGVQFDELCGQRMTKAESPVNKVQFARVGAQEFKECVTFVSLLPHVKALNLPLCEELSGSIYWRLKQTLINVVWGDLFHSMFPIFFKIIESGSKAQKEFMPTEGMFVKSFKKVQSKEFNLTETYKVELSNGRTIVVLLQEQEIIKSIYTNPTFYTEIGQEYCITFDIMYAKTGTKTVVESFYGVVRNQEMDGGQSIKVLGDRAKIDWCFPPILDCSRALDEMAKLYINGDTQLGVRRHHVPVYKDRKSFKKAEDMSKVLTRMKKSETGLPFLR